MDLPERGLPKISVLGREIILLSGYHNEQAGSGAGERYVLVDAEDALCESAERDPDAVAFGYVAGRWIAAA